MDTILISIAASGLAMIITRSWIFERVRMFWKSEFMSTLFSCPQCMGFWTGLIMSIPFGWHNIILAPFISSLIGYLISLYEEK